MPQTPSAIATTIIAPDRDGEAILELSPNRTLMIKKLTFKDPSTPVILRGERLDDNDDEPVDLTTIDKVFTQFKPNCDVEMSKEDGSATKENFKFSELKDFAAKNLTKQSPFLSNLDSDRDNYLKIIRQLGQNTTLKKVIENPDTKEAFINTLKSLVAQLEASEGKG